MTEALRLIDEAITKLRRLNAGDVNYEILLLQLAHKDLVEKAFSKPADE
jgi:hypothetical protein